MRKAVLIAAGILLLTLLFSPGFAQEKEKNKDKPKIEGSGNLSSEGSLNFSNLSLESKSVGSIDLKLAVQKLDINNKSVGTLRLSGKADNAVIKNNGVGSLKASDLLVQTMDIENEGVGSAEVNAAIELIVNNSF